MSATTKLRAPEGFSGLSLEGRSVEVAEDGAYYAAHRDIATLRAHGFEAWHDHPGEGGDIETMTHAQLADAAAKRTRDEAMAMDVERLREMMRGPGADDREAGAITEARIEAMTGPELLTYLKANGVGIAPDTKHPALRAAALDHFGKSRQAA